MRLVYDFTQKAGKRPQHASSLNGTERRYIYILFASYEISSCKTLNIWQDTLKENKSVQKRKPKGTSRNERLVLQ